MRREIDRLTAELRSIRVDPPTDTQNYAQGNDEFEVGFNYDKAGKRGLFHKFKSSWDLIFGEVGPVLMEEATEPQMKRRLSQELCRYEDVNFPDDATNHSINDESFDTIKIQLRVMGFIQKSPKKHVPSDTSKYWSLTPYGGTAIMKARAIMKSSEPPKHHDLPTADAEP